MSNEKRYQDTRDQNMIIRSRAVLRDLPSYCNAYLASIENNTTALTRYAYAVDLRTFFQYLCDELPQFTEKKPIDISIADISTIQTEDIEQYLSYLSYYTPSDQQLLTYENRERAKLRKLSSLRGLYKYLVQKQYIEKNTAALVVSPKIHDKQITHLESNEIADLLDTVETGEKISDHQNAYHQRTKTRDLAIVTLLLGTGIRVSELVGIDMDDIDFSACAFRIQRKGGASVLLYFGPEVEKSLAEYYGYRKQIEALSGHENALFLSLQRRRITTRAVQNLVKNYSKASVPLKDISPHKLRSTYGTRLYEETGDIYLVADVLGHRDVNTTKKHYAAQSDKNRRKAAHAVRLRDEE